MNPIRVGIPIAAGQVRSLEDMNNPDKKILVIIAEYNFAAKMCSVFLIDENLELATNRDFIQSPKIKTSSIGFSLLTDFWGAVESFQLDSSPVFAEICRDCLQSLLFQSQTPNVEYFRLPEGHNCLIRGEYKISFLSPTWKHRDKIFINFQEFCIKYLNFNDLVSEREFIFQTNINERIGKLKNQQNISPVVSKEKLIVDQMESREDVISYMKSFDQNPLLQELVRG